MPGKPSEDAIVEMLRRRFGRRADGLEKGIGDDSAVIKPQRGQGRLVVTTDMLVEEIDFRRNWQTTRQLGWKALAVNLSDLAAMGVRPRFYLISLAIPADLEQSWIEQFYEGVQDLGAIETAVLVGGDLSRSPHGIQISITALGESVKHKILYRSGGVPEDIVYVTGNLGKSAAGLALLMGGRKRGRTKSECIALEAFRTPRPRCRVGMWLAGSGLVHAAMDLSDGISMDLPRLCKESATGAEIYDTQLPTFPDSALWGCNPRALALHGGEDFELLITVPPANACRLEKTYPAEFPPLRAIGRLTTGSRVVHSSSPHTQTRPLLPRGFDHFRD